MFCMCYGTQAGTLYQGIDLSRSKNYNSCLRQLWMHNRIRYARKERHTERRNSDKCQKSGFPFLYLLKLTPRQESKQEKQYEVIMYQYRVVLDAIPLHTVPV